MMLSRSIFLVLLCLSGYQLFSQTAIQIENGKVFQNGKVLFYCYNESLPDKQIYHIKNHAGAEEMMVMLQNLEQPIGMQLLRTEFPLLGMYYEVQVQPTSILAILQDMVNKKIFEQGKLVKELLFPYLTEKKYIPKKLRPTP
jgi:hypothetical protein